MSKAKPPLSKPWSKGWEPQFLITSLTCPQVPCPTLEAANREGRLVVAPTMEGVPRRRRNTQGGRTTRAAGGKRARLQRALTRDPRRGGEWGSYGPIKPQGTAAHRPPSGSPTPHLPPLQGCVRGRYDGASPFWGPQTGGHVGLVVLPPPATGTAQRNEENSEESGLRD